MTFLMGLTFQKGKSAPLKSQALLCCRRRRLGECDFIDSSNAFTIFPVYASVAFQIIQIRFEKESSPAIRYFFIAREVGCKKFDFSIFYFRS